MKPRQGTRPTLPLYRRDHPVRIEKEASKRALDHPERPEQADHTDQRHEAETDDGNQIDDGLTGAAVGEGLGFEAHGVTRGLGACYPRTTIMRRGLKALLVVLSVVLG